MLGWIVKIVLWTFVGGILLALVTTTIGIGCIWILLYLLFMFGMGVWWGEMGPPWFPGMNGGYRRRGRWY